MEQVLDHARITENDAVLTVGVGTAPLAIGALVRIGGDGSVVCLAASVDDLDELRAACSDPRLSFLVGDAEVVPLPDASVDVVLSRFGLAGARDEAETARELYRVLRAGGRVSLVERLDVVAAKAVLSGAGFGAIEIEDGTDLHLAGEKR